MSTTAAGSSNSSRYLDFDEYVDLKLQKTRSSIQTTDVLVALAGVAAMFLGYVLVFVVLDQWVVPGGFGIGLRWLLLSTLLIATSAWLVWKVGMPFLRSVNRLFAAREIEKSEPSLKSNLLNLVDLRNSGREVDPSVMRALEKHAAVQLQTIDVTQAIDHRPLMRTAYVLLAVVVMFCLYALFSPKKISNSIWRSLLPSANVNVATKTEIVNVYVQPDNQPGDQTVLARSRVEISVDLAGEIPHRVWLHYTTADGKFQNEPVELRTRQEGQTRFWGMLVGENGQGLLQDTTYVVRAGDAVSREFHITVEQPPSATVDRVRSEYPTYMKFEPTEQAGANIDTWEGTKITLHGRTNMPVKSATIEFMDDPVAVANGTEKPEEISMAVSHEGRELSAIWTLAFRSDGTYAKNYRVQCRTEAGKTDPAPTVHSLTIRPDLPPEVTLLEPVRDLEAPANGIIPLAIEAHDPDFELSHINLHIEKDGHRIHKEPLSDGRRQRVHLKHDLKLERFVLKAGDTIEFSVEAFDNKQPRPNSKTTPKLKVRIVEPVSNQEVQQKLADDRAERDRKLAQDQQEQNADGRLEQPPMDAGTERSQEKKETNSEERQPMPRDPQQQTKDDTNRDDGNSETGGKAQENGKGAESQNRDGGQKNSADKTQPEGAPDGSKGSDSDKQQPLSTDGGDDSKALEQLIKKLNESKQGKPGNQTDSGDGSSNEPKNDTPKGADQSDGTKPQPTGSENQPNKPAPEKAQPNSDQSPNGRGADNKQPNDEGKSDMPPMPNVGENPSETASDKPGNDDTKPNPKKDDSKPGEQGTAKDDKSQNGPGKKETQPDANAGQDPKNGDMPDKNGSSPNGGAKPEPMKSDSTKPEQKPTPGSSDPSETADGNTPKKDSAEQGSQGTPSADGSKSETGSDNKDTKDGKKPGSSDADGPRKQTKDSPDAKREPATGNEKGVGKPDDDPNAKPTPAKGDGLERDPKDKPATRPGDPKSNDPSTKPKNESTGEAKDPKQQGKTENPKNDQQSGEPGKTPAAQRNEKRDGDPKTANEPPKGDGQNDQRSDMPQGGESGSSKQDKEGKPGSQGSDEGDKTKKPGDEQTADSKTGKPGNNQQPGPGSKTAEKPEGTKDDAGKPSGDSPSKDDARPSNDKKQQSDSKKPTASDKDAKQGKSDQQRSGGKKDGKQDGGQKSESPDGQSEQKPGEGGESGGESAAGKSSGKPQGQGAPGKMKPGGEANGNPGEGALGGQPNPNGEGTNGAGSGDAGPTDDGDAANLEYKKQATELVLKKLQEGLDRGDVDPELLEQLGWTEAEMKRFTERLSKHLQDAKSETETPESAARRQQFEEMLKGLDLTKAGSKRSGENSPQREVNQIESRRGTVPQEYRSAYEKFTRELSRQKLSTPQKSNR